MKTLIALFSCLKQLGILIRLFAISLGESFSLSSDVFLKFFPFLQKKNSRLIIWTKYIKKLKSEQGLKQTQLLKGSQPLPLQSIRLPILPFPHSYQCVILPPYRNFFHVLSCVSKLINIQSEFSDDPLLEFWLLLNLFESYTFSKILMNVVHKVNMKK